MILKRQKLGAIGLAKAIGADGLELDMGPLGERETFESVLADADMRRRFMETAAAAEIQFSSLAMSGFYAQSFAERPTYRRILQDCLDTMVAMDIKQAFLPLGVQGNLVKRPEIRPKVVERLKIAGQLAIDAGVRIGIETSLDAAAERQLLEQIDRSSIGSYFNFASALQNGRNLIEQLEVLGKRWIFQIHCTDEDGVWLENNTRLDLSQIKEKLDQMQWQGWLVAERSRDAKNPRDVQGNYSANVRYLKQIFR